jgi:hypothetical protein
MQGVTGVDQLPWVVRPRTLSCYLRKAQEHALSRDDVDITALLGTTQQELECHGEAVDYYVTRKL